MKKGVLSAFLFNIITLMTFGFVSAETGSGPLKPAVDVVNNVLSAATEVARPILELGFGSMGALEDGSLPLMFVAKILLFILLVSLVRIALSNLDFFNTRKATVWWISLIVGFLGIRTLTPEWIATILLPYTTLGIVMTAGLPFVVYFLAIIGFKSPTMRRIAWIFFAVVFFSVYSLRLEITPDVQLAKAMLIYPITALIAVLFAVFDGTIKRLWNRMKTEKTLSTRQQIHYVKLLKRREDLEGDLRTALTSGNQNLVTTMKSEIASVDRELEQLGF